MKQADASLGVLASQMAHDNPGTSDGFSIHVTPPGLLGSTLRGPMLGLSLALMLVAGLTLLVACTNLSGLILAHAADRRKEVAIRLAIGASRGRDRPADAGGKLGARHSRRRAGIADVDLVK